MPGLGRCENKLLLSAEIKVDVFEVRDQALAFSGITNEDLAVN